MSIPYSGSDGREREQYGIFLDGEVIENQSSHCRTCKRTPESRHDVCDDDVAAVQVEKKNGGEREKERESHRDSRDDVDGWRAE